MKYALLVKRTMDERRAIAAIALVFFQLVSSCTIQPDVSRVITPSLTHQDDNQISGSASPSATRTPLPSSETSTLQQTAPLTVPAVQPTAMPAAVSPTQTVEVTFVPIIGGADKVAFINLDEIWMANLDGSQLTQLTEDGSVKSALQWSPDNQGIVYISGTCAKKVILDTLHVDNLACFEQAKHLDSFQFSPDGERVAVSLDGQLYVVPYKQDTFQQVQKAEDLLQIADCPSLAPYKHRQSMITVSRTDWSDDGHRLTIIRKGYDVDHQVEMVQVIDIDRCVMPLPRIDEFPATRFTMDGYEKYPIIQDFAWDGKDLFALTSFKRNDGFGDLWIYNTAEHQAFKVNPIQGKCCYRDPVFSPDGEFLAFIFRDVQQVPLPAAIMYYIPYGALETSMVFPEIPFPADFFSELRAKPEPILHPAGGSE